MLLEEKIITYKMGGVIREKVDLLKEIMKAYSFVMEYTGEEGREIYLWDGYSKYFNKGVKDIVIYGMRVNYVINMSKSKIKIVV